MGILNLTALPGPVSTRVLPFAVQLSSDAMLLGTVVAGVVGILWSVVRALRVRRARTAARAHAVALRLVVPARSAR